MPSKTAVKPFRVEVQGRGQNAELALVRNGKVFAYIVPADKANERNRLDVAELKAPIAALSKMLKALNTARQWMWAYNWNLSLLDNQQKVYREIKSVIAKAEGRTA